MIGGHLSPADFDAITADAGLPWKFGHGQVMEPAFHRGWRLALILLFFVGYLLQYPVLVLTGIFFIVFRYAAHWYSRQALRSIGYRRRFSRRRTFPMKRRP